MSTEFKLPELGEGVDSADVSQIYVAEDDAIEADQPVMQLETEKAVADLPCPHAGTIVKIHVSEGDTIKVGQLILTIDDRQDEKESTGQSTAEAEEPPSEEPKGEAPSEQPPKAGKSEKKKRKKKKNAAVEKEEKAADAEEEVDEKDEKAADAEEEAGEKDEKAADEEEEVDEKDEKAADAEEEAGEQHEEPPAEERREPADTDEQADEKKDESEQEQAASEDKPPEAPTQPEGQPLPPPAGPATRRLARKLDIDLHEVQGTGPSGRITQTDVVEAHDRATHQATPGGAAPPLPDFEKFGPVERQRLNKIARTAMKRLSASWTTVPHVTQHDLADITQLETARRRYMEGAGQSGPKITLTAIAVKAVATALREFPRFNASLDAEKEELIIKQYYHIGVAVDTENGLLVPVIRDADGKTILEVAAELTELAERARSRKLSREDMEGATFTISNQGGIGGIAFTPIVSFPQVAILGMSRARPELQMSDGRPESRMMLPLSLSYDHRVINGADAARFLVRLSTELSDSFQFLIRA
jgi:pyruvate dehydrogenase E2 component (dihydrolipoamide acetyltransferase)